MNVRRDRFNRMFPARVQKICKSLETLGNCSSRNYEYDQEQVMRAFGALLRESIKCADLYGVTVTAQVDGIEVRTLDS